MSRKYSVIQCRARVDGSNSTISCTVTNQRLDNAQPFAASRPTCQPFVASRPTFQPHSTNSPTQVLSCFRNFNGCRRIAVLLPPLLRVDGKSHLESLQGHLVKRRSNASSHLAHDLWWLRALPTRGAGSRVVQHQWRNVYSCCHYRRLVLLGRYFIYTNGAYDSLSTLPVERRQQPVLSMCEFV